MHASSTFFSVADKPAEPVWSALIRYGVCAAVFGIVLMGAVTGGVIPALPIDLATLAG